MVPPDARAERVRGHSSSFLVPKLQKADLAGGGFADREARFRVAGNGHGAVPDAWRSSPRRAAELISSGSRVHGLIGDHPVYPSVAAFDPELTDGYGEKVGMTGIYMTNAGEQALLDSQKEGVKEADPDLITAGNWGALRLDGVVGLPSRLRVDRVSRRGVEIAIQALDESGRGNGETLLALPL